jgi:hypothetical protein
MRDGTLVGLCGGFMMDGLKKSKHGAMVRHRKTEGRLDQFDTMTGSMCT